MAKQTYKLDYDDVVVPEFCTPTNSNNIIDGITESGTEQFGVKVGGLGNGTFVAGQTLVYDGTKMVSSGSPPLPASSGPLVNDDRYYTKSEIDAMFNSLASSGGLPVAYANITGAPAAGVRLSFLNAPVQVASVSSVMGSPVAFPMASYAPSGTKIISSIITVTCSLDAPDHTPPAQFVVQSTAALIASSPIDAGWFMAASGDDRVAGCTGTLVPVDPTAQSFFYQLIGNYVTGGTPVVAKLIGFFYQ
jgi:hypothetical protein